MKLDCNVCGQDVFAKTVTHAQGADLVRVSTGRCKQCGYGVLHTEKIRAGRVVESHRGILPPEKAAQPSNHPTIKPSNRPRRRP